jgi:hypothetical protein
MPFKAAVTWPALAPFIAGHPDDKRITAHWDDVLRLATSARSYVGLSGFGIELLGEEPLEG